MKIHEIATKTTRSNSRVGRGISAGGGKTAGRGTKGQKARTGKKIKMGFEGGQTKLSARLPKKRGFTAKNRVSYIAVSTDSLSRLKGTTVNTEALVKAGLVKNTIVRVKLLAGNDKLNQAYSVEGVATSVAAKKLIESAGGKVADEQAATSTTKPKES